MIETMEAFVYCWTDKVTDPNYKKQQSEKMKAVWSKRKGGMVYGD
jgi:hypothetical protein